MRYAMLTMINPVATANILSQAEGKPRNKNNMTQTPNNIMT